MISKIFSKNNFLFIIKKNQINQLNVLEKSPTQFLFNSSRVENGSSISS